jgi:sugar phosphate isomerase/epimerase
VHDLRDALIVAERIGIGIDVDFAHCWMARDVDHVLGSLGDRMALVQVDDTDIGVLEVGAARAWVSAGKGRVIPGDGDVHIDRLVRAVLEAGYTGPFELEVWNPAIEDEGYHSALSRGIERTDALLHAAGA